MKVRILRRAQVDLAEIDAWLRRENPRAAAKLMRSLFDGIEQLARLPSSGPPVRDPVLAERGFRALSRKRYVIFFKIQGATVYVHRVLHQRREWSGLV